MSKLRAVLTHLPFVAVSPDGTLDLWQVTPTGDPQKDVALGRQYFAWLLHVMRDFDAPHILAHVGVAWHTKPGDGSDDVKAGFAYELSDAIIAAHPDCPQLIVATRDYAALPIRDAMLALPFVNERPDGSLSFFDIDVSGTFEEAQARGRHYAALTAKFLRDTRHPSFLGILAASTTEEQSRSDFLVGYLNDLVSIAVTAPSDSTVNQRSTFPLFEAAVSAVAQAEMAG